MKIKAFSSVSRFLSMAWQERVFVELSDQLSTLLESGLPLLDSMEHLLHEKRNGFTRKVLEKSIATIQSGEPLSTAWYHYISPLFAGMIQSGEKTGRLDVILRRHILHIQTRRKWLAQVIRVLSYPAMLFCITSALLIYVANFVLPMFQNMYNQLGYRMSPETALISRILDEAPSVLFYAVLLISISSVCLYMCFVKNVKIFTKIPFMSLLLLARTRTLSSQLGLLLGAGLPLLQAFTILHESKRPHWLSQTALLAMEQILCGLPVSSVFSEGWDSVLPMMLRTAEMTGDLADAFERTEKYTQTTLYKKMDRLVRILEPSLLVVMGGVVGMTMYAVFIPMYDFINFISAAGHE